MSIYNKISNSIYNPGNLSYINFIDQLRSSKFSIDLLGIGDPNKRTFEILLSGSLMISEYSDLLWPFEKNDNFSKKTIFQNETDFVKIMNEFSENNELYLKCLKNQYYIVTKYFNKFWLRNYILSKI